MTLTSRRARSCPKADTVRGLRVRTSSESLLRGESKSDDHAAGELREAFLANLFITKPGVLFLVALLNSIKLTPKFKHVWSMYTIICMQIFRAFSKSLHDVKAGVSDGGTVSNGGNGMYA